MPFINQGGSSGGGQVGAIVFRTTTTLAAPASSLSVGSIPATAKTLEVIIGSLMSTVAANTDSALLRFNGTSGASTYGAGPAASAIGTATGGFNNALIWTCCGSVINAPGGARFLIPNYTAAAQLNMEGVVFARTALAGTSADFLNGWSACIYTPGGPITSVAVTPLTGPNWITGAYMTVIGYS